MLRSVVVTVIAGVFAVIAAFVFGGRYEMAGANVRLDRWTGETLSCHFRFQADKVCGVLHPARRGYSLDEAFGPGDPPR